MMNPMNLLRSTPFPQKKFKLAARVFAAMTALPLMGQAPAPEPAQAPAAARKAAGTARERAVKINVTKVSVPRPARFGGHPSTQSPTAIVPQPSVNGNNHTAHDYHD